jgi:hypothetical protein
VQASLSFFPFFLFSFLGRKRIQKSIPSTRVERFQGAGGVFSFPFCFSWGVLGGNGISLPQLEALGDTGLEEAPGSCRDF